MRNIFKIYILFLCSSVSIASRTNNFESLQRIKRVNNIERLQCQNKNKIIELVKSSFRSKTNEGKTNRVLSISWLWFNHSFLLYAHGGIDTIERGPWWSWSWKSDQRLDSTCIFGLSRHSWNVSIKILNQKMLILSFKSFGEFAKSLKSLDVSQHVRLV
jgi:hypothetical protein